MLEEDFKPQYPAELYTSRPNDTAILSPIYDFTFKGIFTQETEESNLALRSFITAAIGQEVIKVTLKSNEPTTETKKQKKMIFDVSVEFDDGELADIEMQAWDREYDYGMRAEIQAARLLTNNAKKSKKWYSSKVYQISVMNFHYQKGDNKELTWYTMQDNFGNKLTDRLNIIFIDLVTIRKKGDIPIDQLSPIERWGLFFSYVDHRDKEKRALLKELMKREEGIMAANNIVKHMSKADSNWFTQNSIYMAECDYNTMKYNAERAGMEKGLKQGIEQGIAKGLKQGLEQGLVQGMEQGLKEGMLQKAVEDAIMLVKEYDEDPKIAAEKMHAPLEKVLEALNAK